MDPVSAACAGRWTAARRAWIRHLRRGSTATFRRHPGPGQGGLLDHRRAGTSRSSLSCPLPTGSWPFPATSALHWWGDADEKPR